MMKANRERILRRTFVFARAHAGKILYYAGVLLVLAAVAIASERIRGGGKRVDIPLQTPPVAITATLQTPSPLQPDGELVGSFSAVPRWNAIHGMWESHPAADYVLPGNAVYNLSAGRVETVGKSGIWGGFIEVQSGEYLLRYASVETAEGIEPGMEIEEGALIATADDSMPGEVYMGAHLHLEIMKLGRAVDPSSFDKKNPPDD